MQTQNKVKFSFSFQLNDQEVILREIEFTKSDSEFYIKHQVAQVIKFLEKMKLDAELNEKLGLHLSVVGSKNSNLLE